MTSTAHSAAENKRQALERLRIQKGHHTDRSHQQPSVPATSSYAISRPSYSTPPTQSRDGTVASRYFHRPSSPLGKIFVPNSSPTSYEELRPSTQRPYSLSGKHSGAPSTSNGQASDRAGFATDPLSAPSGFAFQGESSSSTLPLRRQRRGGDFQNYEDGPARKRVNRGTSEDIFTVPENPLSERVGQLHHVSNVSMDATSLSSDDSLSDRTRLLSGSSKSRLVKHQGSPDPNSMVDPHSDPKFQSFKLTYPGESPSRVQAAWIQARGEANRASALLSDSIWSPAASEREVVGRVKEIEEATKAQRAAVKEKGKQSLIYANRLVREAKVPSTPVTAKLAIDLTSPSPVSPKSPLTPSIKKPQRKRARKLVLHSDSESASSDTGDHKVQELPQATSETRALEYFNASSAEALQELTGMLPALSLPGCTLEQAQAIIALRPFNSAEDVRNKLGQGKRKATNGLTPRMFEDAIEILEEYGSVDNVLGDCEQIAATLDRAISSWTTSGNAGNRENPEEGTLSLLSLEPLKSRKAANYLTTQPKLLPDNVSLKEYQLLGINWLNLLYRSNLSCILADEMGLGKTIQVISFLAHLKEQGKRGPHLIVVPSSTLENWCREFVKFAPSITVQTYYAEKNERPYLRETLLNTQRCRSRTSEGWEVLITTYNLAQGDERDRKFFRKIQWDCCIYDEGHVLKNFQSQRYQSLLKYGSKWRLLLTGTPLQNNLQELVSLLNFILPEQFAGSINSLRTIFKVKGDTKVTLLSQERISRAKKMMTPFVLRRRKDQVLHDLPKKMERIEWCDMTDSQRTIYRDTLKRSRKTIIEAAIDETSETMSTMPFKKSRTTTRSKDKVYAENSSNVLMDLRKAALHPMLFRTRFTDDILAAITKQLLKEPDFKKRGAIFELVKEDMSVMTDSELQVFCASYKSTRKYLQDHTCYLDAGKIQVLLRLLSEYQKKDRKILIFSQFTQMLDILQAVLNNLSIRFLLLTGSTPVDVRQSLVDEFTEDESIPVFLLSTKAGGMGINLTAASVVIMFDQDFNPHNDRQAQDRAYRIGQKRDVEVIKLISKGTIEEDMLRLGETKLALDEAVAGDIDEKDDGTPERSMKTSLLNALRQQLESEPTTED